ncbi:MAG: hypothetical protein AAF533_26755 [Acidobacteriota bacterium]
MRERPLWALVGALVGGLTVSLVGGQRALVPSTDAERGRDRPSVVTGLDGLPEVRALRPGPLADEHFDRGRTDLFDYEEPPAERAARQERIQTIREAMTITTRTHDVRCTLRLPHLPVVAPTPRPEPIVVVTAAPPAPTPPAFGHEYVGLIGPRENPVAILADGSRDRDGLAFRYVQRGQVFENQFRIERVSALQLVVSFTDPLFSRDRLQVPLLRRAGAFVP